MTAWRQIHTRVPCSVSAAFCRIRENVRVQDDVEEGAALRICRLKQSSWQNLNKTLSTLPTRVCQAPIPNGTPAPGSVASQAGGEAHRTHHGPPPASSLAPPAPLFLPVLPLPDVLRSHDAPATVASLRVVRLILRRCLGTPEADANLAPFSNLLGQTL